MKRSILISASLLLLAILTGCNSGRKTNDNSKQLGKPNIVFIFADDITNTAIHALGNLEIKTPNLDDLIRNGTTYTHTYNMGGWTDAICVASRASIMTSRTVWHTHNCNQKAPNGMAFRRTAGRLILIGI